MSIDVNDQTNDDMLAAGPSIYSVAEARRIVQFFAEVTTSQNAEAFANGFTEDCVVLFPPIPILRGRKAVLDWRASRERFNDFVCRKSLRALSGNVFGVTYLSRWTDPKTRAPQERRGVEFWVMDSEQIARWDCCSATYSLESSHRASA